MKIAVFGLGYVGCVQMACLARDGHTLTGVDINPQKVELISQGLCPIIEPRVDDLIRDGHGKGRITATADAPEAVKKSDLSFICVGTPPDPQGHLNLEYIFRVAEEIGSALKNKEGFYAVVIRSTIVPGTSARVTEIIGQSSGKKPNQDFAVAVNPEFLREGSAVADYDSPPMSVVASESPRACAILSDLYKNIPAPVMTVDVGVAEIIKFVNNSFHALKITFANEIANICRKNGIDAERVMDLFCADKKLNLSASYLKPGFAYGGSCLSKDLQALVMIAHDQYLKTPLLASIEESNETQKAMALDLILRQNKERIAILGLSFKSGTDDLRGSPAVALAEQLIGKGKKVTIYDRHVFLSKLIGANKAQIEARIPHISTLIVSDLNQATQDAEILVVTQDDPAFRQLEGTYPGKKIIDLTRNIGDPA